MKLTQNWLSQWISHELDAPQLIEQLTVSGLEASCEVSPVPSFSLVIIGKITTVTPHPKADRLNICTVDCGPEQAVKSIICGAANVRSGLMVAAALPGAQLPNGLAIEPKKLRGIPSEGMLCSVAELGLAEIFSQAAKKDGIWELPEHLSLGSPLWEQLGLAEPSLNIQVPPNRGDCLSVVGLARELGALNGLPINSSPFPTLSSTITETLSVNINDTKACPRYTGRIIKNLNPNIETPWWILTRLYQSGMRSINSVVDILNYVLLEWGAPLHAFDLDCLSGPLTVRQAQANESLTLLNEKSIQLKEDTLVIADQKGPVALAGIMGGYTSAVTEKTTNIFLESAFFNPDVIANRARAYGLNTEASYRFERGVDPALCETALLRATALLCSICGGQAGPVTTIENSGQLPIQNTIVLPHAMINKVLGFQMDTNTVTERFKQLGMETQYIAQAPDDSSIASHYPQWHINTPSWRFDISIPADLIEELARLEGYHQICEKQPAFPVQLPVGFSTTRAARQECRRLLANHGYHEAINYSFTSSASQKIIDPNQEPIVLANPISNELNVLRTQLWGGLLTTLQHNYKHFAQSYRFFEIGTVFHQKSHKIEESTQLAGIASGNVRLKDWTGSNRPLNFFDVKQTVHNSLTLLDPLGQYTYRTHQHPALHPMKSSQIYQGNQAIGFIGELHPELYHTFKLKGPIYLFEYKLADAIHNKPVQYQPFARFPYMQRDIAFWIDKEIAFSDIHAAIIETAGHCLKDLTLFDIYESEEQLKKRSLALRLIWQHSEQTLTDAAVDDWQQKILQKLQQQWAVELRTA